MPTNSVNLATYKAVKASKAVGSATQPVYIASDGTITACTAYGSASVSAAGKWATARTFTIGNTGKSVDGSGNVSWSLSEIGAAASSHTHTNIILSTANLAFTSTNTAAVNGMNVRWYSTADTFSGQPSQWGFLVTVASGDSSSENHQFFIEQSNGSIYHRGTNSGSYTSPPAFKTLLDDSNYTNYTVTKTGTGASGTWGISVTGNSATCTYPTGFTGRSTAAGWGDQTGTTITSWDEVNGGSIDFRRDNPSSGKMSIKVDGRFYGNEGNYPAMLLRYANSYWGMGTPDATDDWIRTTTQGIIPNQSGGVGAGHCGLGTSSWYFSYAYVDTYHAHQYSTGHGYINGQATNGGINMILAGDDVWLGDCNAGGMLGLKASNSTNCGLYFYSNSATYIGCLYSANGSYLYSDRRFYIPNVGSSWIDGQRYQNAAINIHTINNTGSYFPWVNQINNGSGRWFSFGMLNQAFYWIGSATSRTSNGYDYGLSFNVVNGYLQGASRVYSAVWNDYAEFRKADIDTPGYVVVPSITGIATLATERLQAGGRVISDTYGNAVGQCDDAQTPVGLAGRVLAYTYRDKSEYHIGDAVCTAPNGTVDIMTREEICKYPDRILGIVNEIPTYEVWEQTFTDSEGATQQTHSVEVKGRIWIDIK